MYITGDPWIDTYLESMGHTEINEENWQGIQDQMWNPDTWYDWAGANEGAASSWADYYWEPTNWENTSGDMLTEGDVWGNWAAEDPESYESWQSHYWGTLWPDNPWDMKVSADPPGGGGGGEPSNPQTPNPPPSYNHWLPESSDFTQGNTAYGPAGTLYYDTLADNKWDYNFTDTPQWFQAQFNSPSLDQLHTPWDWDPVTGMEYDKAPGESRQLYGGSSWDTDSIDAWDEAGSGYRSGLWMRASL